MATSAPRSPARLAERDLSASQAVGAAVIALLAVTMGDVVTDGTIGLLFSTTFVLICVTVPMSVNIRALFVPGVLPPLLLIGTMILVAIVAPQAISDPDLTAADGFGQHLIVGIINQAPALVIGHASALVVIGLRILAAPRRSGLVNR